MSDAPPPETIIGLRTDMTINEEKVAVDLVIGQDLYFQLAKEANFGTPIGIAYWLRDTYEVKSDGINLLTPYLTLSEFKTEHAKYKLALKNKNKAGKDEFENKIKENLTKGNMPPSVLDILTTALLAEIKITDLVIKIVNPKDGTGKVLNDADAKAAGKFTERWFKFGLAIEFTKPLELLPNMQVNQIALRILSAPQGKMLQMPTPIAALEDPETAVPEGSVELLKTPAANSSVTLNGQKFTFKSPADATAGNDVAIGKDEKESAGNLAEVLATAAKTEDGTSPTLSLCSYTASEQKLMIKAKAPSEAARKFSLAATPNDVFKISGGTLVISS